LFECVYGDGEVNFAPNNEEKNFDFEILVDILLKPRTEACMEINE